MSACPPELSATSLAVNPSYENRATKEARPSRTRTAAWSTRPNCCGVTDDPYAHNVESRFAWSDASQAGQAATRAGYHSATTPTSTWSSQMTVSA